MAKPWQVQTLKSGSLVSSRTGHERRSAFTERVFCSDVLFMCSVNGVQCSVNVFMCSGLFCSAFRSGRCVLSGVKFGGARFFWRGVFCSVFCSACSVLFGVLFGRAERLDFCLTFSDLHPVLFFVHVRCSANRCSEACFPC